MQYGDHFSAIASREVRGAFFGRPYMASIARMSPRSPGEKMSLLPSEFIRNISADHGPRPHIWVSFLAASASGIFFNESKSSELFLTAAAIAFSVFVFAPDNPAPLNATRRVFSIDSGVNRPPHDFFTRAKMVSAAAFPSCCEMTIDINDANSSDRVRFSERYAGREE